MKKLVFILLIAFVLISCDNGSTGGGVRAPANGNAPTLTDIKIVANISQALTGPYLTTLNSGTQYTVLFFASDQDLDISKLVVDYYKNNIFVINQESPVFGQTVVSDVFMAYYTPTEAGTWRCDVYVEDSKGNKSGKKSITVTVTN
jgi:hypothetical protein